MSKKSDTERSRRINKKSQRSVPTKIPVVKKGTTSRVTYEDTVPTKDESFATSTKLELSRVSSEKICHKENISVTGITKKAPNDFVARIPVVPKASVKYATPMPYTFRIPISNSRKIKNGLAKCPPFYLQLDHTLAVVWCLFSNAELERPLGISQMHWALNFLKGIYNRKGEHPKDVAICIQTIQDYLIEQYADMADILQEIKPTSIKTASTSGTSKLYVNSSYLSDATSYYDFELKQKANSTFIEEPEALVTEKVPFSVNYAEMLKNSPNGLTEIFKIESGQSITDIDIRREIECLKRSVVTDTAQNLECSYSRDNMVQFLKSWRREQIDKIQSELKRLHSIENFMESVDKDSFEPYLENHQLDTLVAGKLNNSERNNIEASLISVSDTIEAPENENMSKSKRKFTKKK